MNQDNKNVFDAVWGEAEQLQEDIRLLVTNFIKTNGVIPEIDTELIYALGSFSPSDCIVNLKKIYLKNNK